jgi:hypothetical protein
MTLKVGDILIRSNTGREFDCDIYCLRSSTPGKPHTWAHVASFRRLEDAERMYPNAAYFSGHSDECECIGATDFDCLECAGCSHDEHDHGICLDCGEDRTDDLAARAYDDAKAARFGGDK